MNPVRDLTDLACQAQLLTLGQPDVSPRLPTASLKNQVRPRLRRVVELAMVQELGGGNLGMVLEETVDSNFGLVVVLPPVGVAKQLDHDTAHQERWRCPERAGCRVVCRSPVSPEHGPQVRGPESRIRQAVVVVSGRCEDRCRTWRLHSGDPARPATRLQRTYDRWVCGLVSTELISLPCRHERCWARRQSEREGSPANELRRQANHHRREGDAAAVPAAGGH